jgi:hypothetical protein
VTAAERRRDHPRAVIDTSSLYPAGLRRRLQQLAQDGAFEALWSPWIIAELNRVLVWDWLRRTGNDLSSGNQERCSRAAKAMMTIMLPTFTLVAPLPPYPPVWSTLQDEWDRPIWAAAKISGAHYVISENTRDFPPAHADERHIHEGIEYLTGRAFLLLLTGG